MDSYYLRIILLTEQFSSRTVHETFSKNFLQECSWRMFIKKSLLFSVVCAESILGPLCECSDKAYDSLWHSLWNSTSWGSTSRKINELLKIVPFHFVLPSSSNKLSMWKFMLFKFFILSLVTRFSISNVIKYNRKWNNLRGH